jgi:hypothetical protein
MGDWLVSITILSAVQQREFPFDYDGWLSGVIVLYFVRFADFM